MSTPRITGPTLKVLKELLQAPTTDLSGADIGRSSGLPSGTLYPILLRLEAAGWLSSQWETAKPTEIGRPRRRLYKLTGTGARAARAAFEEIAPSWGAPLWQS
jgi:DNA-binding PadR family transcriptional regulator